MERALLHDRQLIVSPEEIPSRYDAMSRSILREPLKLYNVVEVAATFLHIYRTRTFLDQTEDPRAEKIN